MLASRLPFANSKCVSENAVTARQLSPATSGNALAGAVTRPPLVLSFKIPLGPDKSKVECADANAVRMLQSSPVCPIVGGDSKKVARWPTKRLESESTRGRTV